MASSALLKIDQTPLMIRTTWMDTSCGRKRTTDGRLDEKSEGRYRHEVGVMHACGRSIHMTPGWRRTNLAANKDRWSGADHVPLSPGRGARLGTGRMIKDGCFEDRFFKPDPLAGLARQRGLLSQNRELSPGLHACQRR